MRDPLSFSPGFNRVDPGACGILKNRFNGFRFAQLEHSWRRPLKRLNELYAVLTRLKAVFDLEVRKEVANEA